MIEFLEVRPKSELTAPQCDRYTEIKTMTLGYFEAQIFRERDDGTHYDPANLFSVADAAEAEMLLAALQHEMPEVEFETAPVKSDSGTKFNPLVN